MSKIDISQMMPVRRTEKEILPPCPPESTEKEKELMMHYQRLKDLEAEIVHYDDKSPYLVGMSSEGAFSFYFPNQGDLANQVKSDDPIFDPDQPQLPIPRYSFAEYFRTKEQIKVEQEERRAIEEEERAAWKRVIDLKKSKERKIASDRPKNYRITMENLGMTGTQFIVQDFDYMPSAPGDAPDTYRISVRSQRTIEHPHPTFNVSRFK